MIAAPLVSCIVPTHNSTRYLAEALASIRAQSHRPIELIVADDESSDDVEAVAACFSARFVRHRRAGPPATRNLGVAAATGELVAFLDADDLWLPEKLERQVARLAAEPGLDACTTHIRRFRAGAPPGPALPGMLSTTLLARRAAFARVGGFAPALWYADSADWFLRAADAGLAVALLPDALTLHREHGDNLSRRGDASAREFLRVIKATLDRRRGPG
ncbi:MAG: glycosyltransferase family A protein [Dongiaceae bacterium]